MVREEWPLWVSKPFCPAHLNWTSEEYLLTMKSYRYISKISLRIRQLIYLQKKNPKNKKSIFSALRDFKCVGLTMLDNISAHFDSSWENGWLKKQNCS